MHRKTEDRIAAAQAAFGADQIAADNLEALEDRACRNAPTYVARFGHLTITAFDGGFHYSIAMMRVDRSRALSSIKTFLAGSPTMNEAAAR